MQTSSSTSDNFRPQQSRPYPDPAFETIEPEYGALKIANAGLEQLHTGCRWTEGPVWFGDGRYLVWSDIPNNRMLRWTEETGAVSVFRQPSAFSNGNTRDRQGRLLSCEHGSRGVSRTEYDGRVQMLVDRFEGRRLNAPNDLAVHADGAIWFSDPGYGIDTDYEGSKAEPELPARVYRLDPESGAATVVVEDLAKPNGLCFSPDYSLLYVADTGATHNSGYPRRIWAYPVEEDQRLGTPRLFADLGTAMSDGLRCDTEGRVWTSAGWSGNGTDGVWTYDPSGKLLGRILIPEPVSNLCFGGEKLNRLFITAGRSLYSVYVNARGIRLWES